jgi:inward rectifier potassium channel
MATPPTTSGTGTPIRVTGAPRQRFRDAYHRYLRLPWWTALAGIVGYVLLLNLLFAAAYFFTDGIANARPGMFRDAFYFSIQTFCTIGYGAMYPTTDLANVLVVIEALVGLLATALATGLVFAKFTLSAASVVFSRHVTISPMDGVPTLSFRLGNERGNQIVEAQIKVVLVKTVKTREGTTFYRMIDLPLARERTPAFARSFNALHAIVEGSPLFGATPESLKECEAELIVSMIGTDDTSLQPVHARHTYMDQDVLWGHRLEDVLREEADGTLVLDVKRFHDVVKTEPTEGFPYPR